MMNDARTTFDANGLLEALVGLYEQQAHPAAREVARQARRLLPQDGFPPPPPGVEGTQSLESALDSPNSLPQVALVPRDPALLPWTEGPYERPEFLVGKNMFARLLLRPEDSPNEIVRMGLYYQCPGVDYPDHSHSAEELYIPLSGTARWKKGGEDWAEHPPGTLIHHASFQPHATMTLDEPLLALWAWIGEIDSSNFRFDNPTW